LSVRWTEADKLLKLKTDKTWAELELNNLVKALDELQENLETAAEQVTYWHKNIHWLQSRFSEGKYNDVVGLCKVAHKEEFADEQDYSLNAGRYVGVDISGDDISKADFNALLDEKSKLFISLNAEAINISERIIQDIKSLVD